MSTLSSNVAGTVRPFFMQRRVFPGAGLVSLDKIKKRKKKKSSDLVHSVASFHEERSTKKIGDDKWVINPSKKVGKWRETANRPVFWPEDGSGPIGMPKALGKGKSGSSAPDFSSKGMKALETKLKATLAKMKGGKGPKGSEGALRDMLDAIKSKDPKKFQAAKIRNSTWF